jgi:Glycosyl transferase family 2.
MDSTLIIPIHNRIELITHLLESLRKFEDEIIFIVNDICDSNIFQLLNSYKQNKSRVKVIRLNETLPYTSIKFINTNEICVSYIEGQNFYTRNIIAIEVFFIDGQIMS